MDRRKFVAASAVAAGASFINRANASQHHKGASNFKKRQAISAKDQARLIESTAQCLEDGQRCLAHCADLLGSGDTSMAECNFAIQNMLVACEGMSRMAHLNSVDSKTLKSFASSCALVCEECRKACAKHADHHKECKACMISCEKCIKVCKSIA